MLTGSTCIITWQMVSGLKGNKTPQRFTLLTWSSPLRRSPRTSGQDRCQLRPPRISAPVEPDIPVKLQVTRVNYPCPRSRASSLAAAPSIEVSHKLLSVFNLVLMLADTRGVRACQLSKQSLGAPAPCWESGQPLFRCLFWSDTSFYGMFSGIPK